MKGRVYLTKEELVQKEFIQWLKDKGKPITGLTDVFVNENGNIKTEKRMATTIHISPDDYKDFCKETGKDYEAIKLIAIY